MQLKRLKGKYAGDYVIYESLEEALSNGVKREEVTNKMQSRKGIVGKYFMFDDGWIAPVTRVSQGKRNWFVNTPMYLVNSNSAIVNHEPSDKVLSEDEYKSRITKTRIKFLTGFLFQGLSIEDSGRKYLQQDLMRYSKRFKSEFMLGWGTKRELKLYNSICFIMTWPWFDKVLRENRVIADRYNTLIGAFENQGLTYEYLAKYIKMKLEGVMPDGTKVEVSEKERISAFSKLADIIIANELKQSKSPNKFRELPSGMAEVLPEPTSQQVSIPQPQFPNNLLEEESDVPARTPEAKQVLTPQDEATLARSDETSRYEAIPTVSPDESRQQNN